MKMCAFIMSLAGLLGLVAPATAHASVQASPHKRVVAHARPSMRKTPQSPKRDQVHRGGVDGTITLVQFISNRRPHDEQHQDQDAVPQSSVAQVRASWEHAALHPGGSLTARAVESLPPHRESTHLSI
jgi:hypothetical protein